MVDTRYLYDESFFAEDFRVDHFLDKPLSYQVYENAYVLPLGNDNGWNIGGMYTEEKEYIPGTIHDPKVLSPERVTAPKILDETVIYIGWQCSVWGHTLTDNLKYLWFLSSKEYREQFSQCKLVYVKNAPAPLGFTPNMARLFEIMGIDRSRFVPIEENTRFKRVVLPDPCFFTGDDSRKYYTREFLPFLERVRQYQKDTFWEDKQYEKLYFTYARCSRGRVVGENKLEAFFARQGYKIIAPEEHSLDEQLHMLANCRFFASTVGSCSHNSIFLPEGAQAVFIPRAYYLTEYQLLMDSLVPLDVRYVDASLSVLVKRKVPMEGPFYYYESPQLRALFGVEAPCDAAFWREQLKDLKKYLRKGITYGDMSQRYMPEYYSRAFSYCVEQYRKSHPVGMFWRKCWFRGPQKIKELLGKYFRKKA